MNPEIQKVSLYLSLLFTIGNSTAGNWCNSDPKQSLLQIVAQCIGVSASFGGAIFKSHMKGSIPTLLLSHYLFFLLFIH